MAVSAGEGVSIVPSSGGGGTYPESLGYVSTRWYRSVASGTSNSAVLADNLLALPLIIKSSVTISNLGVRVATGVAATEVKYAIYSNVAGVPTDLLYQVSAAAATTASNSNATAGFASNPTLSEGSYWVVSLFNGAPTITCAAAADPELTTLIGIGSASSLTTGSTGLLSASSYAGGFPSTFPAITLFTGSVPIVFFQVA